MVRDDPPSSCAIRKPRRNRSGCPPKQTGCPLPPSSEEPAGRRTQLAAPRSPKAPSAYQPALCAPGPKPRRFEHLRSRRPRPGALPAPAFPSRTEALSVPTRPDRAPVGIFRASPSCPGPKPLPLRRDPFETDASHGPNERSRWPRELPHLQGFVPRSDPPPRTGCLGRGAARSSHGLSALQGVPPHCGWHGSHRNLPLMGFLSPGASDRRTDPPGCCPQRGWLVSLETADPPGLRSLSTFTNVRVGRGSGVASSGPGVRHRPLTDHL
jgi:hypothetical protein